MGSITLYIYLLVSVMISNVFAKECLGKKISKYVCIPQNYTNSNDESPLKSPYNYVNATLIDVQVVRFDDLVEKLTLKMTLKMRWLDNRLQLMKETNNANISVLIDDDDHIELWRPVFQIQNLISTISYHLAGRTTSQIYGVRLFQKNNTLVSSVTNIYATIHCGLFLENFPFDKQSCSFKVKISSFTYINKKDIDIMI